VADPGLHVYVVEPLAVRVAEELLHIVAELTATLAAADTTSVCVSDEVEVPDETNKVME
jgi:hypothetical protein